MFVSPAASHRLIGALALVTFALAPARLTAQSASEHIALGDKDHHAMNAPSALHHYEEAVKADPKSYEALWKATREAVDVGEYNPDEKERERLYATAELYARRAVEANAADAEGHAQLSRPRLESALARQEGAGEVRR